MPKQQLSSQNLVLRSIFIIFTLLFIAVLATNYKKFLVWNQIVDNYKEDLLSVSQNYYCEARHELNSRSVVNLLKLGYLKNDTPPVDCKGLLEEEALHENQIDKSCQPITDGSLSNTCLSHLIRVKILSPVINLAMHLKVSIHTVFTIFCFFVIFLIAALLSTDFLIFNARKFYLFSCFLMTVSLFMNGRNLLSYLSLSFLLFAMTFQSLNERKEKLYFISALFFAFLFSNVSSGVNLYIWLFFLIWSLNNLKLFKSLVWFEKFPLVLIFLMQLFWVLAGVSKNFLYYGGNLMTSPWLMLNHGLGKYIFSLYGVVSILILSVLFFLTRKKISQFGFDLWILTTPFFLGLILCLLTGLFGYSILSMALIYFMIGLGTFAEKV